MGDFTTLPESGTWFATVAAAALTALAGIWQFTKQQQQNNRHPFLKKQLDLCFAASDTAARLATETNSDEWEKARLAFWQLYWGTLSIVEDREVEVAMVELGALIPGHPVSQSSLPMKSLEQPSLKLAYAARSLILASWQVDLPPLKGMES